MELLSKAVEGYMAHSSMIRRMFEAGIELRKKYGNDKVYDFSLGNPDLPAPKAGLCRKMRPALRVRLHSQRRRPLGEGSSREMGLKGTGRAD